MSKLSLGQIDLGDYDRDWFVVMSKLDGKSTRANVSSVLGRYVKQNRADYQLMLDYTARKHGLTTDECFRRLLNDEDLGVPIPDFKEPTPERTLDE